MADLHRRLKMLSPFDGAPGSPGGAEYGGTSRPLARATIARTFRRDARHAQGLAEAIAFQECSNVLAVRRVVNIYPEVENRSQTVWCKNPHPFRTDRHGR